MSLVAVVPGAFSPSVAAAGPNCNGSTSGETQLNESAFNGSSTTSGSSGAQYPITNVLNGKSSGRFTTGAAQAPGMNYEVNMASAQSFNEVSLNAPDYSGNYPRAINVNVSANGTHWTTLASCSPASYPVTVSFPAQSDRYVEVVLAAKISQLWSIEFFYVYNGGSGTTTTTTGGTTTTTRPTTTTTGTTTTTAPTTTTTTRPTTTTTGTTTTTTAPTTTTTAPTTTTTTRPTTTTTGTTTTTTAPTTTTTTRPTTTTTGTTTTTAPTTTTTTRPTTTTTGTTTTTAPTTTTTGPTTTTTTGGTTTTTRPTTTTTTAPTTTTTGATTTTTGATTTTTTGATTTTTTMPTTTTTTVASGYSCSASTSGEAQLNESAFTGSSATSGANGAQDPVTNVLNGSSTGRFTTGMAQAPGMDYTLNLASAQSFNEVSLNAPDYAGDYPRGINVNVSADGTNWTTVASCSPASYPVTVSFPAQSDQYVQVVLTASVSPNWWSIEYFYVYGASSGGTTTTTGATTTTTAPTTTTTGATTTTTGATTTTTGATTTTTTMPTTTTTTVASGYSCSASTSGEAQLNESAFTGSSATSGANGAQDPVTNVLNGSSTGRFTTGMAQAPGMDYTLNLASAQSFNEVSLNAPDYAGDYPRGINVNVSADGTNWTTVASCSPASYPVTVSFPAQSDQYVQVVLTASVSPNWWSIEYFYVYGASSGGTTTTTGATTTTTAPTTTTTGATTTTTTSVPSAPTVSGVSPASGPNGALVTLAGTGFTGATAVDFGSSAATFTVNSDAIITAIAPPGTGTVGLTVTTPEGTSATSPADQFTYTAGTTPFSVPSPVSGGWQLNGSAQLNTTASPGNLQLTPAASYQAGSAFYPTAVPGVGITASFDTYIGGGSGADGLTFTLADASVTQPTALGVNGGGEGYSGITGLAVSLDTYQNAVNPSDNFVGIANGPVPGAGNELNYIATNTNIPPLRNTVHHFVVTTTSTGITVTMDGTQVLNYLTMLPAYVLVGFTGGTGGGDDIHQVQNVAITSGPPPSAPTVGSLTPNSGTSAGGTMVTLTGTAFTSASAVDFGPNAATFTVTNSTTITATAPAGTVGTVDVTVTTLGGTSATSTADQYTYTPPAVPTVSGVSPSSGPNTGGTTVTIIGTAFTGATEVDFTNDVRTHVLPTTFTVDSDTMITAITPAFADFVGTVDVQVETPGGTSIETADDEFNYTVPPPPTVSGVSPASGTSVGGTTVTISGANFLGATAVAFGLTGTAFTVTNPTTITATSPPGSVGTVDVTVATPGGTSATNASDQYTYFEPPPPTVSAVTPTGGFTIGGTTVSITGSNLLGASAVDFGNQAAIFTVTNSTTITATSPPGSVGTVDVTVTTPGGTSATSSADQYTYAVEPPPSVGGVSPASGPNGAEVTITGTAFTAATAVVFGTTAATFTVNSDTLITAIAPTTGSGTVDVTVTTPGGTSATSPADLFTYAAGSAPFSIPSPVSGGWQLNGSALLDTTASPANLQLTQAVSYQAGSAFYPITVPGVGITASFDTYIGGGSGADGLTFTLADASVTQSSALGVNGGGEGFSGITGYAVSFDTYQNSVNPSDNFVGIANGPVTGAANELNYLATNTAIPPLRNTVLHVVVTTSSTGITVTMDGTQVLSYATALPQYVLVGFTGGTGGGNDVHQVQNVSIMATSSGFPVPIVTGVSPNVETAGGGTAVTITGTGFTGASAVDFGANAATFTVLNSTTITATSPPGSGTVDVTVSTPVGGTSLTSSADQYTYVNGPTVTAVSPTFGPATGGNTVTITGTSFVDVTGIDFGGENPTTTFSVINPTTIVATAPSGALGTIDVNVFNVAGGSGASPADDYTYTSPPVPTVSGVSPASGPTTGGTTVTITGTGLSNATSVDFGPGNTSQNFTVNNPTTITAVVPSGALGNADVTVTTSEGTSSTSAADQFTYTAPPGPAIISVGPGNSPSGSFVTISGSGLAGATAVDFGAGNPAATFAASNATTIYATAPPGSGTVDVTVTTPAGTSALNPADHFTYTVPPAPTVTGVSPASGFSGFYVVVTGTAFTSASAVDFGNAPATFTVNSDTSITATAPAGSGTVDVTVTNSGGTSAVSAADEFTYSTGTPPPTLVSTYRGNLARTGYYPSQTGITASNAATVHLLWTTTSGSGGDYSQPVIANNLVYWGDWNGYEHAATISAGPLGPAGTTVWSTYLGLLTGTTCNPPTAGPSGTGVAAMMGGTPVLYVPGGDNLTNGTSGMESFYALNALTGAIIWKTPIAPLDSQYFLWASPFLYNGSIYQTVAAFDGYDPGCPDPNGEMVKMDANTGAIQQTWNASPPGCTGGGMWASQDVDTSDGSIFAVTGDPDDCATGAEYAPAIVKLNASNLSVESSWTIPPPDQGGDDDFGATPVLFTAIINGVQRQLIGVINKDGMFFALDRSNLAAGPVWQTRIGYGTGSPLNIVSAAWDGSRLYVGGGGTIINGSFCFESLAALNPATGGFIWSTCANGEMNSGITEVPGVVVMGTGAVGNVLFLNPENGIILNNVSVASAVLGETTVYNGVVYVPVDNGNIEALGP